MRNHYRYPARHGIHFPGYHALILAVVFAGLGFAVTPHLAAVKTVYLLPMSSGMDQYLASRLTTQGVLEVVTDPQRADAILTDHLGSGFETRMDELYAPAKKDSETNTFTAPPPPVSTFGRGRGEFFLVDRRTRSVLWSVFQTTHGTRPGDLEHTADRIAGNLKSNIAKAAKPPKK